MTNAICEECTPRILIVDNSERDSADFAETIAEWRCKPIIAEGIGRKLIEDAITRKDKDKCHVALVDMRLFDDSNKSDQSGLELIKQLEPAKTIIVTGFSDSAAARDALLHHGAVDFVGKQEGSERLRDALYKALHNQDLKKSACVRAQPEQITWPRGLTSKKVYEHLLAEKAQAKPSEEDKQADQLLVRLFEHDAVTLRSLNRSVKSISPTPYRRSIVLLAKTDKPEPVVVKFAKKPHIEHEWDAYKTYIDGYLVHNRYAEIKNHKTDWDLGALIYTFLGSSIEQMQHFSEFYVTATSSEIKPVLAQVFEAWERYYRQQQTTQASLYPLYDNAWGNDWSSRLLEFVAHPELNPPANLAQFHLEHPVEWVVRYGEQMSPRDNSLAITHGDMHADNIYVDAKHMTWQSDFERSGPGPIHRDFVQLEVNTLTRLLPYKQSDLQSYFGLVVALLGPDPRTEAQRFRAGSATRKAFETVSAIRQQAQIMAGLHRELEHYHWGLLFTSLFRAISILKQMKHDTGFAKVERIARDIPRKLQHLQHKPDRQMNQRGELERLTVLASCVCYRLSHEHPTWPPDGWRSKI